MDNLRERLYARGEAPRVRERVKLKKEEVPVKKNWSDITVRPEVEDSAVSDSSDPITLPVSRRKYRAIIVLAGLAFFLISVTASSLYLLFGGNVVSGSNITIGVTGPLTVGGGEVLPLQVGISNQNSVAVKSATLIVDYPQGTRSGEGDEKEVSNERIQITDLSAGETRNIPLRVRVFGEENQESEIKVSIEYRVDGSSATFLKTAEPLRYKISHAPIVIKVESEEAISTDQETTIKITVTSNASVPIKDLLVQADYPNGFEYTGSDPAPISGRNIWKISELKPEASAVINLTGKVVGDKSEKVVVKFMAGVAGEKNQNELASILAVADTEFTLEDPFLSALVTIDGKSNETVTLASGKQTNVIIEVKNNSSNPVYDVVVEVKLSGNALSATKVSATDGYYNASSKTLKIDSSSVSDLSSMQPGSTKRLSFRLEPGNVTVQSPQIQLEVNLAGRRVGDDNAREEVSGTIKRIIKIIGEFGVTAKVVDVTSGPTPPVADKITNYRIKWEASSGSNTMNGVVMTAVLPSYVEWTGATAGTGTWSYNSSTRAVEWRVNGVAGGAEASGTFDLNFLPSSSLIGKTPKLVEDIEFVAEDAFTNASLRKDVGDITTEISGQQGSGQVQDN